MNVGKRLRELRGDRSRDKVADDIGVSSSTIGMYECNERVPRDEIKKRLAAYYGISVQQLFFEEECHSE